MKSFVRDKLLANKHTNGPYRRLTKKWRQLKIKLTNSEKVYGRLTLLLLFVFRADSRYIKLFVTSKFFKIIFENNTMLSNILIKALCEVTDRIKNRSLHVYVAAILDRRKDFENSFKLYFELIERSPKPSMGWVTRVINAEKYLPNKIFFKYFEEHQEKFENHSKLAIICDYSLMFDEIIPDWESIKKSIEVFGTRDLLLINKSLLAALPFKNIEHLNFVEDILSKTLEKSDEKRETLRRTFTLLAVCYYRLGLSENLVKLNNKVNYENHDWNIYVEFALGNHMSALEHRGQSILSSFKLAYPGDLANTSNELALVPEKDLCGEVFNALFYEELKGDISGINITCDRRMFSRLKHNNPSINFLPKEPRSRRLVEPKKFAGIPPRLADFLDSKTYKATRSLRFVAMSYSKYYASESCKLKRQNGWLRSTIEQQKSMREKLGISDTEFVVAFSANSTIRSRVRDMHMVDLSHWGSIFSMQNCVFININPSLEESECHKLNKLYGCKIITPEYDLYNDFEALIDILSTSNAAVVPANNLMDFAAATATPSFVFSPSNIMKVWCQKASKKYLFSDHVSFIFKESAEVTHVDMAEECRNQLLSIQSTIEGSHSG